MAAKTERVKVKDPHSGATLTVNANSPQAKAWGSVKKAEPVKKAEGSK